MDQLGDAQDPAGPKAARRRGDSPGGGAQHGPENPLAHHQCRVPTSLSLDRAKPSPTPRPRRRSPSRKQGESGHQGQ